MGAPSEVNPRRALSNQPFRDAPVRRTSPFEVDPDSGLALPKGAKEKKFKSKCPTMHKNVDRVRSGYGYKCKDCKKQVVLYAIATVFATVEEVHEIQRRATEREAKAAAK